MNFDIGFAFSEGPGPGPGPLYKVCPLCFDSTNLQKACRSILRNTSFQLRVMLIKVSLKFIHSKGKLQYPKRKNFVKPTYGNWQSNQKRKGITIFHNLKKATGKIPNKQYYYF